MIQKKFFCYVDETGQDSLGGMFIVSVVVPEKRDEFFEYMAELEISTGKGRLKWGRADAVKRLNYLEELFNQRKFHFSAYYSIYKDTKLYKLATISTISRAIHEIRDFKKKLFTVLVDGLGERDQRYYGSELRHLGIPVRKVRGVKKDGNDALIRLADSICGFVRDIREENDEKAIKLYLKAVDDKILVEV